MGSSAEMSGIDAEHDHRSGVLIPGLRDAHFHPVGYTATVTGVSLKDAEDFTDVRDRLRQAASRLSGLEPLVAMRLDDETLAEARLPTRRDIDDWVADRPVLLHRYCGHVAVANSEALVTAGIERHPTQPRGGVIDIDGDGVPTGVLRETAVDVVSKKLPATRPVSPEQFLEAMRGLTGLGLTSLGAIVGCGDGLWASLGDETALLQEVAADLPLHLRVLVIANDVASLHRTAELFADAGDRVTFLGLKRFSDGSLGGHTAAMHEPFSDAPGQRGTMRLEPHDTVLAREAVEMGCTVAIHAIGDEATGSTLDLMEQLLDEGADPDRLRIEHASVVTAGDIERFGGSGVIASVQPAFLGSETDWLPRRVGPDRLARTYPFRSLLDAGGRLAGGSDCPVEPPHPLLGMALARDRAGIVPDQSLTAAEAFRLFTDDAARAIGEPEPLSTGASADLVLLDRDPVDVTPDALRAAKVLATWVGGVEVSLDPKWSPWRA